MDEQGASNARDIDYGAIQRVLGVQVGESISWDRVLTTIALALEDSQRRLGQLEGRMDALDRSIRVAATIR